MKRIFSNTTYFIAAIAAILGLGCGCDDPQPKLIADEVKAEISGEVVRAFSCDAAITYIETDEFAQAQISGTDYSDKNNVAEISINLIFPDKTVLPGVFPIKADARNVESPIALARFSPDADYPEIEYVAFEGEVTITEISPSVAKGTFRFGAESTVGNGKTIAASSGIIEVED